MSNGKTEPHYFSKNIAIVSLQSLVVYVNWLILYPYLLKKERYITYILLGIVLIYLSFTISFYWIGLVLSGLSNIGIIEILLPKDFFVINFYSSFWTILKGSSPYTLGFLISAAYLINCDHQDSKHEYQSLKMEKLQRELQYLREQINPHFLFNSLNNIHTLTLTNSQKASEYSIKLSEMLRFMIYEVKKDKTTLQLEIKCITDYFDLVSIRSGLDLSNNFNISIQHQQAQIEPSLIINLVENGIKHSGIEFDDNATFSLKIIEHNYRIKITMKNSTHQSIINKKIKGIGMNNVRRRLELTYLDNFNLSFSKENNEATTVLTINLKQ